MAYEQALYTYKGENVAQIVKIVFPGQELLVPVTSEPQP